MAHLQVQPSINDARSAALLDLIERLGALDLTPLLVYRIDSAPDSVLLALAWQFDMLGPQ
ncbi:phage tail protein, partial [bacterium]|nr:phage tail protein [bacterium]